MNQSTGSSNRPSLTIGPYTVGKKLGKGQTGTKLTFVLEIINEDNF
jgi:hypothetical protein